MPETGDDCDVLMLPSTCSPLQLKAKEFSPTSLLSTGKRHIGSTTSVAATQNLQGKLKNILSGEKEKMGHEYNVVL